MILFGDVIWVYMLAKKNSSHFDIGGVYMLHRGTCAFSWNMTIHIGYQGSCGS